MVSAYHAIILGEWLVHVAEYVYFVLVALRPRLDRVLGC